MWVFIILKLLLTGCSTHIQCGLFCLVIPFWKFLHRHAQMCASQESLKSRQVVMKIQPWQIITKIILTSIFFSNPTALVGNACLVRGSLQSQCEKWSHHVGSLGHGNPEGDWNQQPSASFKAQTSYPGDGVPHESLSSSYISHGESMRTPLSLQLTSQRPKLTEHISVSE